MPSIIVDFPSGRQTSPVEVPAYPEPALSAKVAVGVNQAVKNLVRYQHVIDHADEATKKLVMMLLMDVIGRASTQPGATVNDLLLALWEQIPEDTQRAANGGVA